RAVGTAFAVRVRDGRTAVTVTEGVVEVSRDAAPRAPARLRVGEGIEAGPDGLSPLRTIDAASALAWRRGQIVFHQQPLSAVVAELNRYRTGRIVIASSKIADRIVSGTFEIDRPDSVPQVLETALGIQARSITPWLVVLN
ncbi:MAG: hypothetical protein K0Q70_2391, partial [Rhodospirillales bacterium]|nr:hypothetical protein [Rhodospirillales bacterium]